MAKELKSIDITHSPELLRLAEEIQRTQEPKVLVRESEELAVLVPVSSAVATRSSRRARPAPTHTPPTDKEVARSKAGILAAAGSWKDLDAAAFKAYIRQRRQTSSRPPVEL